MSKAVTHFYLAIASVVLLALISTACGSETSSVTLATSTVPKVATTTSIPPSPTPIPPTATPIPNPLNDLLAANEEYLLSVEDQQMRELFSYPQFVKEYDMNGMHSYYIRWWMVGNFELNETITVAQQPWAQIPEENFPGSDSFSGNPVAIESAVVGDGSQVFEYENGSGVRFVFIKGNSLVNIYARGFTVADVVQLGMMIDAQIPDQYQNTLPISFPDQVDQDAFDKNFKEVTLGVLNFGDNKFEPTNIFQPGFFFWKYVAAPDAPDWWSDRSMDNPMWETAVYDLQNNRYVYKMAAIWSADGYRTDDVIYPGVITFYPLTPGLYEFKLAIKSVLVVSLPFEIR